ncbi:cation diffusion facilitator family transporter [Turneriella parva]|uniref:Cation diffusion facilitator family transporter n=1 Tax=Turneriella parva (strain ATCC BAA-1111 / DSM 21527 / NCTC 11395 / H) TaxID=869212 RepID=I4BAE4_TURPD|nr:cation diffusion facilitator family transporter [Turneriella parva]AFM14251.1 cation diffusion facilitator family transporter [Turneriella parva DSM 21527]
MGHHHDHSHHHHGPGHEHASNNLLLALALNLGFAVIELVGGLYTNSVAILSDALHDLGDTFSLGVAWYLQKISGKPRDEYYSYGYRRFSLLGALVVSSVLLIGVALVIRESVERLLKPEQADAKGMLLLAVLGVAINGFAALRVKKGHSLNERAVYLHLLEDVLGWIAVLVSSIVMIFFNLPFLDPLVSLGISLFILFNVYKNLRSVVRILLLEVPGHVKLPEFESAVRGLKHVKDLDDLHLWTLDGQNHVLTMQVIVSDKLGFSALRNIKHEIRELARGRGIMHTTIEFCCNSEDRHQHH